MRFYIMVVDNFFSLFIRTERKDKRTETEGKVFQRKYITYQNFNTEGKITKMNYATVKCLRENVINPCFQSTDYKQGVTEGAT